MKYFDQILSDAKASFAARGANNNLVFGYLGAPGVGKTAIMAEVAQSLGAELWDSLNLAASSPMDIQIKIPNTEEGVFTTLASDDFPWAEAVGDRKIIFFMDEKTNASSDVNKTVQQFLISRRIGGKTLGQNVIIMIAGNRQTDKAGSGLLSTAVYNRVCWRNLEWTSKHSDDAVEYLVGKYQQDTQAARELLGTVQGYFAHQPIMEKDFTDALAKIGKEPYIQWCSPRSLEALLCRVSVTDWKLPGITDMAGNIGMARATGLATFASLLGKVEKYEKIIANPTEALLPEAMDVQYAVISMISARVSLKDFSQAWKYIARFKEVSLRMMAMKMAIRACPALSGSPESLQVYRDDKELREALSNS